MGMVHEEITLKNTVDVLDARRGIIKEQEIRQATVTAMVDTGAATLVINEEMRERLGLEIKELRWATFANNTREKCKITEPVEINWKNRLTTVHALVVPDSDKVLLGAIPLEDMDLMVDPVHQVLTGVHGDDVVSLVM